MPAKVCLFTHYIAIGMHFFAVHIIIFVVSVITNDTVEFFVLVIRWAGKTSVACCFINMVECHSMTVTLTSRQRLLVFIHTLKHSAMMIWMVSLCHDISIVLPGPGWRAAGLGFGGCPLLGS